MKLAIGGKGGTGKTTLAALLALSFRRDGSRVIAVDADPDANLASTLGYPGADQIVPIAEMRGLIEERTGAKPGGSGAYFKLNPRVDDVPDRFVVDYRGIKLLVMGTVREPAGGCLCPENVFLKELIAHLILYRDEVLIMDMEAGIEHLGRGTAQNVDAFLAVVEPSGQSLESGKRIVDLARRLGIPNVLAVFNKVASAREIGYLTSNLPDIPVAGIIPYSIAIRDASLGERSIEEAAEELAQPIKGIRDAIKIAVSA
ncbi:MAG: AAA family ATPase [PVC group bacterium]